MKRPKVLHEWKFNSKEFTKGIPNKEILQEKETKVLGFMLKIDSDKLHIQTRRFDYLDVCKVKSCTQKRALNTLFETPVGVNRRPKTLICQEITKYSNNQQRFMVIFKVCYVMCYVKEINLRVRMSCVMSRKLTSVFVCNRVKEMKESNNVLFK